MMDFFYREIKSRDTVKAKQTAFILRRIVNESVEEMAEAPPEVIEFYFKQAANLMMWAATGERIVNIPLPDGFELEEPNPFGVIESVEYTDEMAAIEE